MRERLLLLWRFRKRTFLALWSQWTKGKPPTLSSPSTHPSFLGREGPLPCGSSRQLARAPNPRDRALPPRLTNPAQWLQWPSTRCCCCSYSSPPQLGTYNNRASTCLVTQEIDYHETSLRLLLPKDVDQSATATRSKPPAPSWEGAQAHTAPRVQARPGAFTKKHFPHLLQ